MSAPTVLVLAAGQGTRMRSATPKVLHELCGRPMVLWPVSAALHAGAGKVVVVDSPARALADVLPEGVELAIQPQSNGTGGAVLAAAAQIDPDAAVVILSGDVPLVSAQAIAELLAAHAAGGAPATMATTVLADPSGYGRVVRDGEGNVVRVVETKQVGPAGQPGDEVGPAGQAGGETGPARQSGGDIGPDGHSGDATPQELQIQEVNTGIFAFAGRALLDALPRLSADNAQGELYLPQVLDILRADGHAVAAHMVDDPALVLGVNDRAALAQVTALAQQAILRRHMLAGVTIVNPAATVIDIDVQIGSDTTIEPFTTIKGATRIGSGCTIRHAYILDSTIEDGVSVGPFAYLRPGTHLRKGAKVGTFVEVKNSSIGEGTKIPHLSYIGDADVGERSNLGAGTITANYDGFAKHRTTIGKGVRGGVDVALIAPVTVGEGAWTAAGSTITEDVPPGALGVARERQTNIEGFAERRAAKKPSQ